MFNYPLKIKFFFLILLSIIILIPISCKTSDTVQSNQASLQTTQEDRIVKILNQPRANITNPLEKLPGSWKAVTLGQALSAKNYTLPSSFIFRGNNTYEYSVKIGRINFESTGKFILDQNSIPWKIDFIQNYPRHAEYQGIIEFTDEKTIKIIFYDKNFLPRPDYFNKNETQIFIKD